MTNNETPSNPVAARKIRSGEPWSRTDERQIFMNHNYPLVNIPKSFLKEVVESLFEREIILVSRDPKTHAIFREIKLVAPKKSSKELAQNGYEKEEQKKEKKL